MAHALAAAYPPLDATDVMQAANKLTTSSKLNIRWITRFGKGPTL
jgi:hypothetical protein